jgi:hypothetical protein
MRRIAYVENKSRGLDGAGRIGWVGVSRSGRTFEYGGRRLRRTKSGYKYNCVDEATGETYWVSGPSRDGADKLYGGLVQIDDDARIAYWTEVRGRPDLAERSEFRSAPSTRTAAPSRRNERYTRGK